MQHVEDISRAGGAVELDAMYRINPTFAVGVYGSFSKYATGDHDRQPVRRARRDRRDSGRCAPTPDELGGSVGSASAPAGAASGSRRRPARPPRCRGLELARLQIGVDYRVSEDVSISPVIGGSLNMFVSEDSPMTTKYSEITDKKANFIGFAGLAGRFDLGGKR